MTAAHVMQAVSIEQHRADWMADYTAEGNRHGSAVREQARTLWPLYLHWQMITGQSLRSVFLRWLTGEETPSMTYYQRLNAGRALASGLDFGLPAYQLATLGRALDKQTAGEVQARLETPGGLEAMAAEQKRQDGTVTLPTSELPAVKHAIQLVSYSEDLPAPEALALTVQAFAALPGTIQQAALQSARTGEALEDSARKVVKTMLDPRRWLSARLCSVPACAMPSEELHHVKLPGTRFRSQDILLPLCLRHHGAPHGQQAAHANHQDDWVLTHWPSVAVFWAQIAHMYADWAFQEDS